MQQERIPSLKNTLIARDQSEVLEGRKYIRSRAFGTGDSQPKFSILPAAPDPAGPVQK